MTTPHRRMELAASEFAEAWREFFQPGRSGPRPLIEHALKAVASDLSTDQRAELLGWRLTEEVRQRKNHGQRPILSEYEIRFAKHSEQIMRVFRETKDTANQMPAGHLVNPLSPMPTRTRHIRCPHCSNPLTLIDDRPTDVRCPSCGSSFKLRDAPVTSTVKQMRQLGKFQLLERLGSGSFGSVWKARDTVLDTLVVLKIPHSGLFTDNLQRERFFREARAAAQLRHPGIVAIHDVAELETDGGTLPALVSDLVDGVSLRELLGTRHLTAREAATLIADLAEAIEHAHEKGIVHRDLKPANVMIEYPVGLGLSASLDDESGCEHSGVTVQDRQSVDHGAAGRAPIAGNRKPNSATRMSRPRPRIVDFGLAIRLEDVTGTLTIDGELLGTPVYMSPEQAAGNSHLADARSDIWALGVILYEILTHELPFRGSTNAVLRQIQFDEPRLLRQVNEKIPRDLETITLKCLAKEPQRRYSTSQMLAEDLRRWLRGEPTIARPVGIFERLWLFCRRNQPIARLAGAVASLLIALVVVLFFMMVRERLHANMERGLRLATQTTNTQLATANDDLRNANARERDATYRAISHAAQAREQEANARQSEEEARRQTKLAQQHLYAAHMNRAQFAWEQSQVDQTVRLLDVYRSDASESSATDKLLGFKWFYWDRLCHSDLLTLGGHDGVVENVAFSPDGKLLASASRNGMIIVWDAKTGHEILTLKGHGSGVGGVVFSPDGKWLASASFDQTVKVWDLTSGEEMLTLRGHTDRVQDVAFSPDGKRLASASDDKTVKVWDASTGQSLLTLNGHSDWVRNVAFSPDGNRLASASWDQTVKVWDSTSGQEMLTLKGHTDMVEGVSFSPDGKRLASASYDQTVKVWDATPPEAKVALEVQRREELMSLDSLKQQELLYYVQIELLDGRSLWMDCCPTCQPRR